MEREAVSWIVKKAREAGYAPFDPKAAYRPGDRVYYNNRGKALILTTFGTRPLADGVRIIASHIDSPRLDLKPNPLYEEAQICLLYTSSAAMADNFRLFEKEDGVSHGRMRGTYCVEKVIKKAQGRPAPLCFFMLDRIPFRSAGRNRLESTANG